MNRKQMADAQALVKLVDTAPETLRDEMTRAYGYIVVVCRYILTGEVRTVSAAFGEDVRVVLAECRNLVTYQTWQAPGDDIPCIVTTDEDGFITSDSTLTVGGIHVATFTRRDSGRLATLSLATISGRINWLMLNVTADFSKGADALTEMRDNEGTITGYSFNVRHRTV